MELGHEGSRMDAGVQPLPGHRCTCLATGALLVVQVNASRV